MAKTIVGLFDDFTAAMNTVPDLVSAGVRHEDISLVANDTQGEFANFRPGEESSAAVSGAGAGAAIGGLGGLLLGLGVLAVPGVGPILAAGPIATTLAGATIGAATGGLIGALNDIGVPEEEARYYVEGIRRGGTVLTVKAADDQVDRVTEIMRQHRAVDIEERIAQWRQGGEWGDASSAPAAPPTAATSDRTARPALDLDEGRVVLKEPSPTTSPTRSSPAPHAAAADTSVTKVNARYSPHGKQGQKYLAAGVKLSMRLWEEEQPGRPKPQTRRDYETVGYVIKGRAELSLEGQTVLLEPGDSWVVPRGATHSYRILEPFTAVEATSPPAEVHGRDE